MQAISVIYIQESSTFKQYISRLYYSLLTWTQIHTVTEVCDHWWNLFFRVNDASKIDIGVTWLISFYYVAILLARRNVLCLLRLDIRIQSGRSWTNFQSKIRSVNCTSWKRLQWNTTYPVSFPYFINLTPLYLWLPKSLYKRCKIDIFLTTMRNTDRRRIDEEQRLNHLT